MDIRRRFMIGMLVVAGGCARLVDADEPYKLNDNGSSGGNTGGAGGASVCTKDADCPPSSMVCRVNQCLDGSCRMQDASAGTPCAPGLSPVCNGFGACVECVAPEHCVNIVETQCTKRACVNNTCKQNNLSSDSAASPALQQPGDCKVVVCDGFGGTKTINDDMDTPNDDNGCTADTCLNGSEVHTKVAVGTNCGTSSTCNAAGQCVGCSKPSDCAGNFDFCKERTCQSSFCGIKYTANGTPLPSSEQTAQDCFILVCDGAGNKITKIDMNDGPSDGNACTKDSCTSDGTPVHPPEMISMPCTDGENDACDGLGNCKKSNGKTCADSGECVSGYCVDGVCCENACDTTCNSCNASPATAGTCTMVPFGQTDANAETPCSGAVSCDGNGACKKNDGQSCTSADDCVHGFCSDGYCCENACLSTCKTCGLASALGKCVNVPRGATDNNPAMTCNGTKVCDGAGLCKLINGQPCTSGSECLSGQCNPGSGICK